MTIHILGLGESLSGFVSAGSITIGVNDIHSKVLTDYVVCVDKPSAFNTERQKVIRQTKCKGFYSQVMDWSNVVNFKKIEFNNGRGVLTNLDNDKFCYSISSPFVAVILAYKLGAKRIVMHGVDFQTHVNFQGLKRDRALNDFKNLNQELKARGVCLCVSSPHSALSEFLELHPCRN